MEGHSTVDSILRDAGLYMEKDEWFSLLQDEGNEMNEVEAQEYCGTKKKKPKHISHGDHFYPKIYELGLRLYSLYLDGEFVEEDQKKFPKLPKNRSDWVHAMGKFICSQRRKISRADIHTSTDAEFLDQVNSGNYADKNEFYLYSQSDLLRHVHNRYGRTYKTMMEFTPGDKLRLMGIIIDDEDVRPLIADLTFKSKAGDSASGRRSLDASNPKRLAAIQIIHRKFIDLEVVVSLPPEWLSDATKEIIAEHRGDDYYTEFGNFNPNNRVRIALPWSPSDLKSLLAKVTTEYNAIMVKYTAGTGGGPGDSAAYVVWETRDPANSVRYFEQGALLYLTIVVMWDQKYSWPFVTVKDKLPKGCRVEDEMNASGRNTPRSDNGDQNLVAAVSKLSEDRGIRHSEMMKVIRGDAIDTESNQQQHYVRLIMEVRGEIGQIQGDVSSLKRKKEKLEQKDAAKDQGRAQKRVKKIERLDAQIKQNKSLMKTLSETLEQHRSKLDELNKKGKTTDANDLESLDSDSSDSDSSVSNSVF